MRSMGKAHRVVRTGIVLLALGAGITRTRPARAEEPGEPDGPAPANPPSAPPPAPASEPPAPAPAPAPVVAAPASDAPKVTVGGYAEAYYSYNLNNPANGITNFRWIDNRHNTIMLQTAVLDVAAEYASFRGHVALQAGPTAEGWYSEANEGRVGASGAAPLGVETWKHVQQANVGWKAPVGRGLLLEGGLFLTTIGYEGPAVKDNWNWSRSNLFLALPFYHAGVRATYELTDRLTAMAMVTNGWNSLSDTNDGKSGQLQLTYKIPDALTVSFLYMGGPERSQSSPEGRPIRHLFDLWAQADLGERFSVAAHGDAGFEDNAYGLHWWRAGALYARAKALDFLYVAARGDAFFEDVSANAQGTASSLFYGSDVWSLTGTLDFRPIDHLSFRAEYRHDVAGAPLYFAKGAEADPATGGLVPNARTQDTVTLGLTGWF